MDQKTKLVQRGVKDLTRIERKLFDVWWNTKGFETVDDHHRTRLRHKQGVLCRHRRLDPATHNEPGQAQLGAGFGYSHRIP